MASQFGIFDIERLRAIVYNPANNWRWAVHLPPVDGFVPSHWSFTIDRASGAGVSYSSRPTLEKPQIPFGLVESIDIQPTQIDMDARFGSAFRIHYPRFSEAQQITINFYEDGLYNVSKYLMAWRNEMHDEFHNFGLPKDYKKEINIFAFDILSNFTPTLQIQLIDCWPMSAVGGLNYTHDSSGYIVTTCDFAVDRQRMAWTTIKKPSRFG